MDFDEVGLTVEAAELCGDAGFADRGLREDAVSVSGEEQVIADDDEVGELFVLPGDIGGFEKHVIARALNALREVTPVGRYERAGVLVRAGSEDLCALGEEQVAGKQDAFVSGGGAGFDDGEGSGAAGPGGGEQGAHVGCCDFGEGVAEQDEVGGFRQRCGKAGLDSAGVAEDAGNR